MPTSSEDDAANGKHEKADHGRAFDGPAFGGTPNPFGWNDVQEHANGTLSSGPAGQNGATASAFGEGVAACAFAAPAGGVQAFGAGGGVGAAGEPASLGLSCGAFGGFSGFGAGVVDADLNGGWNDGGSPYASPTGGRGIGHARLVQRPSPPVAGVAAPLGCPASAGTGFPASPVPEPDASRGQGPRCSCGQAALQLMVRKQGPNQGRPFFACPQSQDQQCGVFCWGDQPPPPEGPPCQCGFPAKQTTVRKDGPNQGKQFWSCVRRQCEFFDWCVARRDASGGSEPPPIQGPACHCGVLSRHLTVRKGGPNQGNTFWGCATRQCNFFDWCAAGRHIAVGTVATPARGGGPCPQTGPEGGGPACGYAGGGGAPHSDCFKCGGVGHWANNCPNGGYYGLGAAGGDKRKGGRGSRGSKAGAGSVRGGQGRKGASGTFGDENGGLGGCSTCAGTEWGQPY